MDLGSLVQSASQTYGIPQSILAAQVQAESSGNPSAVGSAGEIGLMQISPALAQSMGLSQSQLLDPATNLNAGASYMASLYSQFGNWQQALQAYNAGPNAALTGSSAGQSYAANIMQLANQAAQTGGQIPVGVSSTGPTQAAATTAQQQTPVNNIIPGAPQWLNNALAWLMQNGVTVCVGLVAVVLIIWAVFSLFGGNTDISKLANAIGKAKSNVPEEAAAAAA